METLKSEWFHGDPLLNAALNRDDAHIIPGTRGSHVLKIQKALEYLFSKNGTSGISDAEIREMLYGRTTAAAVLRFKTEHKIINFSYQTAPDSIVGKMTMQALDKAMAGVPHTLQESMSQEVGAAIVLVLLHMDRVLATSGLYLNTKVRYAIEVLRMQAAIASRGNMRLSAKLGPEYNQGVQHLSSLGIVRPPIVFAAAPAVAAGAAITALEIAIAALALILLLCIISEDFRKEVSRLANAAIQAAAESVLSAVQEASQVRQAVQRCKNANPNPNPKCRERQNEFDNKDNDFKNAQGEATQAIQEAVIRFLQLSEFERKALLVKVRNALVKLEKALRALKDAANALFKDCGCLFPPF